MFVRLRRGESVQTFNIWTYGEDFSMMRVCQTERLILRQLQKGDAEFMLELLNEPSFLQNIGDKGVRTIDDAWQYILNGPVASYERFGFGLYLVELKETLVPM